jgi:hypothetical protein
VKTYLLVRESGWRIIGVLAVVAVSVSGMSAQGADLTSPPNPYGKEANGINVVDNWLNNGHQSSLLKGSTSSAMDQESHVICNDLELCDPSTLVWLQGNLLLPNCESDLSRNCVAGVSVRREGVWISAHSLGQAAGPSVDARPELALPEGSSVGKWKVDATPEWSETLFATHVDMDVNFRFHKSQFVAQGLVSTVVPYRVKAGSFRPIENLLTNGPDGKSRISTTAPPAECVWVQPTSCGEMQEFDSIDSLALTIRIPSTLGGWLMGRVTAPTVSSRDLGDGYTELSVAGAPTEVPKIFVALPSPIGDSEMEEAFPGHPIDSNIFNFRATSRDAARVIGIFRNLAQDKSIGNYTSWNFSSKSSFDRCSSSNQGFLGFVSTNASVYQGSPPSYEDGYFNYSVAGYHFGADGITSNLGKYDLVIRSVYARCLYGFKNAPISATVAVVGEMGEEKVATTIVSEKDGWLKLAAYGFTFSEKEIQVQLRQSQIKTLTNFTSGYLSSKQKAEIRAVLAKSDGNTKFICTGIRYYNQPVSDNIKVRARAKAACDYAKSIDPNFSYWYQTKTTQARSYNGKVMIVSKG